MVRITPRLIRRIASHTSFGDATLSPELENAAAARLGALALVVAIASAVVVAVAYLAKAPAVIDPRLRLLIGALDVALSLILYFAITRGGVKGHQALSLGFAYAVGHGILSSVLFHSMTVVAGIAVRGWTPVAVWALVYPLVVPTPRRQVWIATLATAATDPLGMWVNVAAGAPLPVAADLAQMFLPTVLVCILAPVAAGIVYNLTVEVKRAREMGSYRLVEKLGQGGMGEVWRAEHRMLTRGAAVKLIRPIALGPDEGRARAVLKRFEREAQATAALRSPHTVAVYDYGVADDGAFHYVMELLEGFSLQELVERFGPVPPGRAVRFLRQACHSLAEAHATGLIHRDLKPANMFVCRLGLDVDFVKVLDFGLVKVQASHAKGVEGLTVEGAFMGTPGFIPPEVALGNEGIDGRADLYALGCVAYYLLTGCRVFENDNAMKVVVAHIQTPPIPPSQRTTQPIPAGLEAIIMRCLEKEPENRPSSAAALSSELLALGLEDSWSEENARGWWATHDRSDLGMKSGADEPEPAADATVSQTRRRVANRTPS